MGIGILENKLNSYAANKANLNPNSTVVKSVENTKNVSENAGKDVVTLDKTFEGDNPKFHKTDVADLNFGTIDLKA